MDTFAKNILAKAREAIKPVSTDSGSPLAPSGYFPGSSSSGDAYSHNKGWVHASLRVILNRIAAQPFHLARRRKDGERPVPTAKSQPVVPVRLGKTTVMTQRGSPTWFRATLPGHRKSLADGMELVETHPFLDAIRDPNDIMVSWSLWFITVASLELTGKAHWWVFQEPNGKIRIWPLPSHWFTPIHENGQFYAKWRIKPANGFGFIEVPGTQVVYFYLPDPGNPFGAVGTLAAQSQAVKADEAISTAQERAFVNGLFPGLAIVANRMQQPSGIVSPTSASAAGGKREVLTEDQRNAILWHFKRKIGGVYRSDEPFIIDGFIDDIKRITLTNKEMDFLNSSKVTKERVTQGFGTNPISMGQVEAASRASSAIADDHLIRNVVTPRCVLISEVMSAWMSPIFAGPNEELYGYLEEASSSDADLERLRNDAAYKDGTITVNERRAADGYPPIRGGNVLLVDPTKIPVPVTLEGQEVEQLDPIWELPPPAVPGIEGENAALSPSGRRLTRLTTLHKALGPVHRKALWLKLHSREERSFAQALRKHFDREVMRVAAAIRKQRKISGAGKLVDSIFDVDTATAELTAAAKPHVVASLRRGAVLELELRSPRRSVSYDVRSALVIVLKKRPPLPEEINNRIDAYTDNILAAGYWSDINKRRRQQIAEIVGEGTKNDLTPDEIANQIEDAMGGRVSASRARNIARTETTGALNAGGEAVRLKFRREGRLKSKEWVTVGDAAVRDSHVDADGQRVRPRAKFDVGGERCYHPGDPTLSADERCGCRCWVNSVLFEDVGEPDEEATEIEHYAAAVSVNGNSHAH